ncbi:MAG: hypothetical protein ACR2QV_13550 [Gammaproteobacteria bacterium]
MAKFNFVENAEAIYEKSISATPFPFRKSTQNGLDELLMDRFGEEGEITEAGLVGVIKEHTPTAFLGMGMKAIAPLLSDPSLAEY